nr:MAG: protein B [Henan forest noda-like virus 1]
MASKTPFQTVSEFPARLAELADLVAVATEDRGDPPNPTVAKDLEAFRNHLETLVKREERAVASLLAKPAVAAWLKGEEPPTLDPEARIVRLLGEMEALGIEMSSRRTPAARQNTLDNPNV